MTGFWQVFLKGFSGQGHAEIQGDLQKRKENWKFSRAGLRATDMEVVSVNLAFFALRLVVGWERNCRGGDGGVRGMV